MWAVSLIQPRPILPLVPELTLTTNTKSPFTVSANSHPQNVVISSENIGGLDHNLIPKQKQEERQLSGSDVLWALQRAATQKKKNKKNKKNRELSSAGGNREEDSVDHKEGNLRPLRIKNEWGVKLNELEKRLQELSDII